jgi:hypothetical protein
MLRRSRRNVHYDPAMLNFGLTGGEVFAVARLEGLVSLDAWRAVLEELATALATTAAPPRLVIDMTAVLGYLGIPERKAVGALMAQHFSGIEKVALVVQAHKITEVVSGEARRNGLNLRLFPEYDDAMAWVSA